MSFLTALISCLILTGAAAQDGALPSHARIQTSMGDIDVELYGDNAPVTVQNFIGYATSGYYDRLVFHRVVEGTLIQGGGYTKSLFRRATTQDPIVNEATNGIRNTRGTLAMARFSDPDSATSQFFINLKDNPFLDRTGETYKKDAGYAVFGKVVAGMEIADAIGMVETGPAEGEIYFEKDVPVEPVLILRIDPITAEDVGATAGE
ncbi:MAG: peptidylprolyl isomerase [Pseudomonadota bacterium]